jgi:hypothetical protein
MFHYESSESFLHGAGVDEEDCGYRLCLGDLYDTVHKMEIRHRQFSVGSVVSEGFFVPFSNLKTTAWETDRVSPWSITKYKEEWSAIRT